MEERPLNHNVTKWWSAAFCALLTTLMFSSPVVLFATSNNEQFESPAPILVSEAGSTRALTANPDNWTDTLPKKGSGIFAPESRVVVFVTNLALLPNENANAFRAFAEDAAGKRYRLTVENIQQIHRQPWIYGLTVRIYDANGYNGQPEPGELGIRVSWRGNISNRVRLNPGRGVKLRDVPGEFPTPAPTKPSAQAEVFTTAGDRKRFMEQATFGPTNALDFRLRQIGLRRWIDEQFNTPYPTIPYPNFAQIFRCGDDPNDPEVRRCHRDHFSNHHNVTWLFRETFYGEDQLRRRLSWALHQIWVVSHPAIGNQRGIQEYIEILDRNAFGNYRDLMKEMTLSPAMGAYLDMATSTRANPNENYPRELLQLFAIGLYLLNQDGTLILDNQGNRIPTYDQPKIDQFTKVFTGWTYCNNGTNPACPNAVPGVPNFVDPLHIFSSDNHDLTTKTLFDYPGAPHSTIAACSNCTTDDARRAYANDSLNKTLDNIFYHPNVGPFVGKLLIQHFVTSDPSPAYVGRVAAAFSNNGAGVRGDMKAVIKAVLLDPEARGSRKSDPTFGKLREPLQLITNILRTFNVRAGTAEHNNGPATPPPLCQNRSDGAFGGFADMGQAFLAPPSVFNYFPPDYVVPGTDTLGPEFAIANTGSSFHRNNAIFGLTYFDGIHFQLPTTANPYPEVPCGTSIDRSEVVAWIAADPTGNSLIEGLNTKMMHGTMSEAIKSKIRTAISGTHAQDEHKARQALYLVASSSQYQVQR